MRRNVIHNGIVAAAVASAFAIGCNREPEPVAPIAADAVVVDDDQLATYVQSRFFADNGIRASEIDVAAENGVVTLRGTVANEEARQHAMNVAKEVEGVRSVNDQLRVEAPAADAATAANTREERAAPAERTPGWITTKIQSQYFLNPEIKPWNVDVSTSQDGVVTLRGEVDEAKDREEAERIARETDGVSRVVNRLRVRGETPTAEKRDDQARPGAAQTDADADQPDAWVTAKIQAKYFLDTDVKGLDINVDTRDGVVTLTGEVESEAERRQAVALARNTEGVKSVTDQLRLETETAEKTAAGAAAEAKKETKQTTTSAMSKVDDAWITTKIQSKFFLDADVKGRDINVDTKNGVVTLNGTVESDAEKQAAATIAQETDGVTRVNNQLKVDTTAQNPKNQ